MLSTDAVRRSKKLIGALHTVRALWLNSLGMEVGVDARRENPMPVVHLLPVFL